MKDREFTFWATADRYPAKPGDGSRKLRPADLDQLGTSADRARLLGIIHTGGPRHYLGAAPTRHGWRWWVDDTSTDKRLAEGWCWTKRGMYRRRWRAYIAVKTAQAMDGAGSAGWAAEPSCQHERPFTGPCTQCGRGDTRA
jgi:hypothetical protein